MSVDEQALQTLQEQILLLRVDPESLCRPSFNLSQFEILRESLATWRNKDGEPQLIKIIGMVVKEPTYRGSAEEYNDHILASVARAQTWLFRLICPGVSALSQECKNLLMQQCYNLQRLVQMEAQSTEPEFKAVEDVRHCIVKLPEAMASVHQMYGTRQQASFVMSINTLQMWQELSPASPEGKLHTETAKAVMELPLNSSAEEKQAALDALPLSMFSWPGYQEYKYVRDPELYVLNEDLEVRDTDGSIISPRDFVDSFPRGCWVLAETMLVMSDWSRFSSPFKQFQLTLVKMRKITPGPIVT